MSLPLPTPPLEAAATRLRHVLPAAVAAAVGVALIPAAGAVAAAPRDAERLTRAVRGPRASRRAPPSWHGCSAAYDLLEKRERKDYFVLADPAAEAALRPRASGPRWSGGCRH